MIHTTANLPRYIMNDVPCNNECLHSFLMLGLLEDLMGQLLSQIQVIDTKAIVIIII